MLRTVDTDVVVLAVAFFSRRDLEELWIAFGATNALSKLSRFSTRSQGVTRHLRLLVGGRVLPGIPGWHTKKAQMYSGP